MSKLNPLNLFKHKSEHLELYIFDCVIAVQVRSSEIGKLLRLIYSAFLNPSSSHQSVNRLFYDLGINNRGKHRYFVATPGGQTLETDVLGHLLFLFEKEMTIELQKKRHDLFFVHAAVCGYSDGAFLIAAPSGTGKSTTTWALLHQGMEYLSDELAPIDLGTMQVWAYPRALGLKREPPFYSLPASTLTTAAGFQVPVEDLGGQYQVGQKELKALFFLEFAPEAPDVVIEPVSAATATAYLYSNSLNALAHDNKGLGAATSIAQRIQGFRLVTTRDVEKLSERINTTLASI